MGELGPDKLGDLNPGQTVTTNVSVASEPALADVAFDGYVVHMEVFDCAGPRSSASSARSRWRRQWRRRCRRRGSRPWRRRWKRGSASPLAYHSVLVPVASAGHFVLRKAASRLLASPHARFTGRLRSFTGAVGGHRRTRGWCRSTVDGDLAAEFNSVSDDDHLMRSVVLALTPNAKLSPLGSYTPII